MKVFIVITYFAPYEDQMEGVFATKRAAFRKIMAIKEEEEAHYRKYGYRFRSRYEIKEEEVGE